MWLKRAGNSITPSRLRSEIPQGMKETEPYLQKFERFESETKQPGWVFPLRKAGIARFAELGFPTLQDEDWRFTNVTPIAKLPFKPVDDLAADSVSPETVKQFTFGALDATRLVFINGHFAPRLSVLPAPTPGVTISNLASALTNESAFLEKHLGRYADTEKNSFSALNTAFFSDGGF